MDYNELIATFISIQSLELDPLRSVTGHYHDYTNPEIYFVAMSSLSREDEIGDTCSRVAKMRNS
jgi:hypothetical protein